MYRQKTQSLRYSGSFTAILTLVVGALGLIGSVLPAHATMIPVLTNSDTVANDGFCSLREAIAAANMDAASGSSPGECPAGSGSDTITVPAMVISPGSELPVISSPMEVVGSGVGITVVRAGVEVTGGQVTLRGLTSGRIVVRAGTVEISDARMTGSRITGGGGGLRVEPGATVTVRRTTIDGNRGKGAGNGGAGGIANRGTLFVHESLVAGNASNRTGGIWNGTGATLHLRNTTVSGNEGGDSPLLPEGTGGLVNNGFAVLNNVTITENKGRKNVLTSFRGGGLLSTAGATTIVLNSIIANNDGRSGPNDCAGALSSDSRFNLLEDPAGCQLPAVTDTFLFGQDPKLGPLADNGGPTRTHLPDSNSPVVDAGSPPGGPAGDACEPIDQRGFARPVDGDGDGTASCDIGAFEFGATPPVPPVTCNGRPATIVGTNNSETIIGTLGPDVIVARGGNDTVNGRAGNDVICGNTGNDRLSGDQGNDHLDGGNGKDILKGGTGNDRLFGKTGPDAMDGQSGKDFCNGGIGIDTAIRCERKSNVP